MKNPVPVSQRKYAIKNLELFFGKVPGSLMPGWLYDYATITPIVPGVRKYSKAIVK